MYNHRYCEYLTTYLPTYLGTYVPRYLRYTPERVVLAARSSPAQKARQTKRPTFGAHPWVPGQELGTRTASTRRQRSSESSAWLSWSCATEARYQAMTDKVHGCHHPSPLDVFAPPFPQSSHEAAAKKKPFRPESRQQQPAPRVKPRARIPFLLRRLGAAVKQREPSGVQLLQDLHELVHAHRLPLLAPHQLQQGAMHCFLVSAVSSWSRESRP